MSLPPARHQHTTSTNQEKSEMEKEGSGGAVVNALTNDALSPSWHCPATRANVTLMRDETSERGRDPGRRNEL